MNISEGFGELGITISKQQIITVEKMAVFFPLRKTHPLTFNGPYLGVDPIAFTPADYNALFEVFHIHPKDVEAKVKAISSIDTSYNVISDPYNLLCIWLCHLAPIYIKDKRVCHDFMTNVLRLFHYKIFCSVVNNSFRHGANKGILDATLASLSRKSDIIRYESWYLLIESHVEKMLNPQDRFYQYIVDASPDDMFLRVISENQTSLRQKIVTYAVSYYEAHKAGDSMGSVSAVAINAEGEKILAQTASVVDSASSSMISDILNPNMFVHEISVSDVAKQFSNVSDALLKRTLLRINAEAVIQASSRKFDMVKTDKEGTLYIGVRVLILEIIRSMIRICRTRKVNLANRSEVFKKMVDIYSSSRSNDKDVLDVKRSVALLIDPFNMTVNPASQSALRLAVIYYIVYRVINKMKI